MPLQGAYCEEISNDYRDVIYAWRCRARVETRRKAFIRKWQPQMPRRRRQPGAMPATLAAHSSRGFPPTRSTEVDQDLERDRAIALESFRRRIETSGRAALRPAATHAVLGAARLSRTDHHAHEVDGWQTLASKPDDQHQ